MFAACIRYFSRVRRLRHDDAGSHGAQMCTVFFQRSTARICFQREHRSHAWFNERTRRRVLNSPFRPANHAAPGLRRMESIGGFPSWVPTLRNKGCDPGPCAANRHWHAHNSRSSSTLMTDADIGEGGELLYDPHSAPTATVHWFRLHGDGRLA